MRPPGGAAAAARVSRNSGRLEGPTGEAEGGPKEERPRGRVGGCALRLRSLVVVFTQKGGRDGT